MASIIIAAHNEASVIDACLESLLAQRGAAPLEIIVSANGCTDDTAARAVRPGVRVIDRPEPGKAAALNAAEAAATSYPRIYLDADITVAPHGIEEILATFATPAAPLAVVPRRRLDIAGRPWPVRSYFAINERLPAFRKGLFGRGMIAVSEAGRARFDRFPDMIADDLFLDSQFSDQEKAVATGLEVVVQTPFTTADLMRRMVRVRRGNADLRAAAARGELPSPVRPADRWAWLRDVVLREPRLTIAAIPYLGLTIWAGVRARRPAAPGAEWGRDESTRTARPDS